MLFQIKCCWETGIPEQKKQTNDLKLELGKKASGEF